MTLDFLGVLFIVSVLRIISRPNICPPLNKTNALLIEIVQILIVREIEKIKMMENKLYYFIGKTEKIS